MTHALFMLASARLMEPELDDVATLVPFRKIVVGVLRGPPLVSGPTKASANAIVLDVPSVIFCTP